jgi:DNA helicase IV
MKTFKEELLEKLYTKIDSVKQAVAEQYERIKPIAFKSETEILKLRKGEREHAMILRLTALARHKELQAIESSPFFFKCVIAHNTVDVRFRNKKEIHFGKYEFSEQNIYSWVAPIAVVRFSNPGQTSFRLPNGTVKEITIHEKEQYMIVNGKVLFYAHETEEHPRELIYQEHFSTKKGAFVLPEIVEIMEKAQDDVIRTSHFGPFAIAGPAGSGKTTLALHRVAYLVQSPESMDLYPSSSIIVFVQDSGTKEYFSHLLPDLGIHNVKITTFFEWASAILKLDNVTYVQNTECELDKLNIKNSVVDGGEKLNIHGSPITWSKNIFNTLKNLYSKSNSESLKNSFEEQIKRRTLDRLDITLALMIFKKHKEKLKIETESNRVMRMGKIVKHTRVDVLDYSLVVVDEFQNYLPEQLQLFKSCVSSKTESIIYVGDLSQKIQHGTIEKWGDFYENIAPERQIRLHKVYRNTKQILEYARGLGYKVEIPEALKQGSIVQEKVFEELASDCDTDTKVFEYVEHILKNKSTEKSIGILSFSSELLAKLKERFKDESADTSAGASSIVGVKFLTIAESQGVEFDIVCLVGVSNDMFGLAQRYSTHPSFKEEKYQIYKDLLYIALTRSMNEMHVVGSCRLKDVLENLE